MGGCSCRDSIKVSYNKSELFDVQRMLETQSDIMPIYDKYPQLMTYKFTNLKLDFAEYIIHIHNNKLLNSCLLVKEIKDYIDVNNILKSNENKDCDLISVAYRCRNSRAMEILGFEKTISDAGKFTSFVKYPEYIQLTMVFKKGLNKGQSLMSRNILLNGTLTEGLNKGNRNSNFLPISDVSTKDRILPLIEKNRFSVNCIKQIEFDEENRRFDFENISKDFIIIDQSKIIKEINTESDKEFGINNRNSLEIA